MSLIPSQREYIILDMLERHGVVTVTDVCTQCNCSPVTVRRDFARLELEGKLVRTHGGAIHINGESSPSPLGGAINSIEARLALAERADVLIVTPNETTAWRSMIERARRASIPIIAEAANYSGATTSIGINDYHAGLEAGIWVSNYAQQYLDGKVNVLDVGSMLANTVARSRGFADGLRYLPPAQRKLIRVISNGYREIVSQLAADVFEVHTDINVIFGINDSSTFGALQAFRAAGLDERELLLVSFGLEGNAAKEVLERGKPRLLSIAMFPELMGRTLVDAAISAYCGEPLPERITMPFALVTSETLYDYYDRGKDDVWTINWARVEKVTSAGVNREVLNRHHPRQKPQRIGYMKIFSVHEWYQNLQRSMREYAESLGIVVEVVDLSHDISEEIDSLKRIIGTMAARFVQPGDTIILDAGQTTTYLARALRKHQNITVITNSLSVLAELQKSKGITLVSTGGEVRQETLSLVGHQVDESFGQLRADKLFLAGTGLSLDFGLSNSNIAEATAKQAMIQAARETILLVDNTKIGMESLIKVAPLGHVHKIITDAGISPHDRVAFSQRGIDVIIAEEGAVEDVH